MLCEYLAEKPFEYKIFCDRFNDSFDVFTVRVYFYGRLLSNYSVDDCKDIMDAVHNVINIRNELRDREDEYLRIASERGYDDRFEDENNNPLPDQKVWCKRYPTYSVLADYLGVSEQAVKQYDPTKRALMLAGLYSISKNLEFIKFKYASGSYLESIDNPDGIFLNPVSFFPDGEI